MNLVDWIIILGYFFIFLIFFFNIIVLSAEARRSHRLNHQESYYSLLLAVIGITIGFIILLTLGRFDQMMCLIIITIGGSLFSVFGLSNLIYYFYKRRKEVSQREIDFSGRESVHHELIRKLFHIILFFGIIAMLVISNHILKILLDQGAPIINLDIMVEYFWGMYPDGIGMHLLQNIEFGQGVVLMLFMVLTTIFVMNEGSRLGKWFYFPLEKLASIGIREKEADTVASYVYFSIGMVFASVFIYPIPLFSIIGILCFADTAASLFGRKYGRHKLGFNKTKSWEGSIGGVAVCIVVTFLLVGIVWGLVATLVFFIIDAATPRLPISDNIGIPFAVTGAYLLLSVLQIPMHSILFAPFL